MNSFEKFAKSARDFIPEGITLLENDGALPLCAEEKIAVFGRGQFEYVKSGTGSGGRVNCPYVTTIIEELEKRVSIDKEVSDFYREFIKENPFNNGDGWRVPASQNNPILDIEFVRRSASVSDKAMFVLTRTVGESYDCKAEVGNWYLSEEEENTIKLLSENFKHLIVLINSGNLIDMNWVKKYNVGTVVYVWQGGQEGGRGTVDALMGDVPPSGRLPDTIADSIDAYPSTECFGDQIKNIHKEDIFVGYRYFETFASERILYPFGYGLNYTKFAQNVNNISQNGDIINISFTVNNIGNYKGKDVAQVYYSAPSGKLGKPARELITFKKTKMLAPGESETLEFSVDINDFASYDDSGKSGFEYAYVLEAGEYSIYVGENVRAAKKVYSFNIEETKCVMQCTEALAPIEHFERMIEKDGKPAFEEAPVSKKDMEERMKENLPEALEITGDKGISLRTVATGEYTLDEFIAQFTAEELMLIIRGEGMSSPKASVPGTASCFAGVTKLWNDKGVPVVTTCDGPSGIRMESAAKATCIPTGTLIAASWSPDEVSDMFDSFADEMLSYGIDVILAPGVNIHRNPLCGRNFEYFSEDPRLAGAFAAKIAERLTNKGVYCTLKHFAVNSQETNRSKENEVLSERALREIYLKVFEIAVRSGYVKSIMTSYNVINGSSAAGCYDLTTTILRGEWGYDSFVMTDWWTYIKNKRYGTLEKNNLSAMVKAQNDVYMVVRDAMTFEDDLNKAYSDGYLTLGELQRSAKNIVKFAMQTLAFKEDRKSDMDSLENVGKMVFEESIEMYQAVICSELDGRYQKNPKKRVELSLPDVAFYCLELDYAFATNPLEQCTIKFFVDNNETSFLTVAGTNGETASVRSKACLKENSVLYIETPEVLAVKVYKLS